MEVPLASDPAADMSYHPKRAGNAQTSISKPAPHFLCWHVDQTAVLPCAPVDQAMPCGNVRVKCPLPFFLSQAIQKGKTATVSVEPVQGEGGCTPVAAAFLEAK